MTQLALPSLDAVKTGAVLLVDKPYSWTSFDAIRKIRSLIKTKIGHCGTLDPLATGLLICCTGKMTKRVTEYQQQEKEYTGVIALGATTPTFDLESEPENERDTAGLTTDAIDRVRQQFLGDILQTPPIHSAIKKNGQRVYELARAGTEVKLNPRPITIHEFDITQVDENKEVAFRIVCSTGTYIRSIANDFGAALGVGGYLKSLRRTRIGAFAVSDALSVSDWVTYLKSQSDTGSRSQ